MKKFLFLVLVAALISCNNAGTPGRDYSIDNTDNDDTALKPTPAIGPAIDSFTKDSISK